MIRLPTSSAAITAPLVASNSAFPGIHIGRSVLDGRPFNLSAAMVDDRLLPSTNSITLGGLGSGKSATRKVIIGRETIEHAHQTVVIDSFGEDNTGEWTRMTRHLGGKVIEAGNFTLNPCSTLLPREVREELIRSLIAAVEPAALTPQSAHALQHALNNPKATHLNGVVDALIDPEDGRWPADKLTVWGEGVAMALSRYTEGSLQGLFDGLDASLPPIDLPMITFDFSRLDRNSPAIPSLMAAIACWVEHVWLPQSTAPHRHLVLEEAWQILLSPATAELIQRLLKNSRKAGVSLDVVMHTLSDLGEGKAQDLARLCEVLQIGRLSPEEASIVGQIFGLPAWVIKRIPTLAPGQAVWKVGPNYIDIIETIRSEEEKGLTDTSLKRRQAQGLDDADEDTTLTLVKDPEEESDFDDPGAYLPEPIEQDPSSQGGWGWAMPPNVLDARHHEAVQAAREGRCNEAAELASLGERQDITAHGLNSDQAVAWLSTRAAVADLCGRPDTATHLRATVTHMGKEVEWWTDDDAAAPGEHRGPQPPVDAPELDEEQPRRAWPLLAASAALLVAGVAIWPHGGDDNPSQKAADAKPAASAPAVAGYAGVSATQLTIDGIKTEAMAVWSKDGRSVVLSAWIDAGANPKLVQIDAGGQTAQQAPKPLTKGQAAPPIHVEVKVPIKDRNEAVRLSVMVGGPKWKPNTRPPHLTIELRPDKTAVDTATGKRLTQQDPNQL
ncbi:hypothetical protein [Streptomyces sp. NPDC050738]|uniref:hypothetical protein n=1 Tax=Streptomyces sp. NPDC050738 TaxID=3154744 RepID=UPI00343533A7